MAAGTSAVMAGVAASQAVIAQSAAHEARVAQCKTVLSNFNSQGATVSEMKEYAGCVEMLHPTEMSADAIVAAKVLFVVALAGAAFQIWKVRRSNDFTMQILSGARGFIFAPLGLVAILGLVVGIHWLFS